MMLESNVHVPFISHEPYVAVIPTTTTTISKAFDENHMVLADPRIVPGALHPTTYFTACSTARHKGLPPPSATLFTDQFVNAPEAVIPINDNEFTSAIELVALHNHCIDVRIWTDSGFEVIRNQSNPATQHRNLIRSAISYYRSCDALGAEWVMREFQRNRLLSTRVKNARAKITEYESLLMHTFEGNHLPPAATALLSRFKEIRERMPHNNKA